VRTVRYVGRRFLILVPQMLLISLVTFILIRMLPGDPARLELGPLASQDAVDRRRGELRLDDSVPVQYGAYLRRLSQGDFGTSWVNGSDVRDDLYQRVPATLELITIGLVVVLAFFIPFAIATSIRGGGLVVRGLKKLAYGYGMIAGALPDFWLGLLLIYVFFVKLGWAPGPTGRLNIGERPPPRITGFYTVDGVLAGDFAVAWSALSHLILPVITLAFVYGAPIFKMTQSKMAEALRSDYTYYAEALGLSKGRILVYAFRNAAPSVIVISGVISGYLLGGAVLIETVFNLNGVGQYAVQAVTTADYAPIQAFVLVAAVFTMLVYLAVDLFYFISDPRVEAGGSVLEVADA
jgi:ABC-type dipeptide/oligopeptide/nickel transport system permease component